MKPNKQPRLLKQPVPADNRGSRSRSAVKQRRVPAEVPLAELRKRVCRKLAEARRSKTRCRKKGFFILVGCAEREEASLIAKLKIVDRWIDASGTGGNAKAEQRHTEA